MAYRRSAGLIVASARAAAAGAAWRLGSAPPAASTPEAVVAMAEAVPTMHTQLWAAATHSSQHKLLSAQCGREEEAFDDHHTDKCGGLCGCDPAGRGQQLQQHLQHSVQPRGRVRRR